MRKIAGFNTEEHDLIIMNGFDDCIVGVVERFGQPPIVCYDREAVINQLMRDGMDRDEAEEWHSFNHLGAWWGDATPAFLHKA